MIDLDLVAGMLRMRHRLLAPRASAFIVCEVLRSLADRGRAHGELVLASVLLSPDGGVTVRPPTGAQPRVDDRRAVGRLFHELLTGEKCLLPAGQVAMLVPRALDQVRSALLGPDPPDVVEVLAELDPWAKHGRTDVADLLESMVGAANFPGPVPLALPPARRWPVAAAVVAAACITGVAFFFS